MERKQMYKMLYNAARQATAEPWKSDTDRVKEVRDMRCYELFGKDYEELDDAELDAVITSFMPQPSKKCASPQQVKTLRFYALACAIRYCSMNEFYLKDESGYEYKGETLRDWLLDKFEASTGVIPTNAFSHLHRKWINPKSHQFLIEGKFRSSHKAPERFYYHYLEPQECQYLINRFRAIAENFSMKIKIEDYLSQVSSN